MRLSTYPKMLVSFHSGWDELRQPLPSISAILLKLVLPMSLLPSLMIVYAGRRYGDYYAQGVSPEHWNEVAFEFFLAELITVPLMAWVLRSIASTKNIQVPFQKSFVLAAYAPVPLWLSSLILFVPNFAVNVLAAVVGLAASFALIYHGLPSVFGMDEDVESLDLAFSCMAVGGVVWAVLLALVLLPTLSVF